MKTRTELIRALVEPELQAQLLRAAQEQDRSLSYTMHEIPAAWGAAAAAAGPGGGMTTRPQNVDQLAAAIRKLIEALIAQDQEARQLARRGG
jgi:hypothetical protein